MDTNLDNLGEVLQTALSKNQPNEAYALINQIHKNFTEGELSSFTIDVYLLDLFNNDNGLLWFFSKVLHCSEYKKVKLKCMELLFTLVNNCTSKVHKYFVKILKTYAPVVRSSVSAAEKGKSLELITLIIQKANLHIDKENEIEKELTDIYNTTLLNCLSCRFDKSNTVQEELLITIGAVAKKFPGTIAEPSKLRAIILNHLNNEMNKTEKNKSLPLINGAVTALSSFLENFPFDPVEEKTISNAIYTYLKTLADPKDASRRTAFREALSLITKHITLLSDQLYNEAEWWHTVLLKWLKLGTEDRKTAYAVLNAFHQQIAVVLSIKQDENAQKRFKYFLDYFLEVIRTTSDTLEMQIAIRGLGLLSQSFKTHITPSQIYNIFISMSQTIENSYILNPELSEDHKTYLPHYIQTLSFITANLPRLDSSNINCLQNVSILMIKIFPQIFSLHHHLVIDAFILTCFKLLQCDTNMMEKFLENVVYQGVLWTCSHPIAVDAELYKNQNVEICTYKNYLPFWTNVLNIVKSTKYEKYEINLKTRKTIVRKLYDELIRTLFLLINKLNLTTKLKDSTVLETNPETAFEAVQKNDFVIFINVVDFYQDILDSTDQWLLKLWIPPFINKVIMKSTKYPFVSGFYKLLSSCLKVCDNLKYFEGDFSSKDDVNICYQTLCKFLQEMLWKMKQYKNDLQVACMHTILAAPVCTIKDIVPSAAPVFIALFSIGRSYLKLAHLGIDTLERWTARLPKDCTKPFLKQVLPSLDSYLKSRSLGGSSDVNPFVKHRKTKLAVHKQKVVVENESELLQLQLRILTFIGQLDIELALTLVTAGSSIDPVVWSDNPYLKITLPYADTKIMLHLDMFVPRVIELAVFSSDRKMRVSACELLHAIVIIMLGISHQMHDSKLKDLDGLMKAVIDPVIKLGCDGDEIVQQLYSTLAKQLTHYYSHPRQMYSSHTEIMVKALKDAVAHPTDPALRDFAGICIKEFVYWTIKQANTSDLEKNPTNIKVWITTINSFSTHPEFSKRLGAVIIYNHIYSVLREEVQMFNMFWLEILQALITNLSFTQICDADDQNCVDQIYTALKHIERGLVEKHSLFNEQDNNRRTPRGFEGNTLKDAVLWLLKQTGSINPYCRERSMDMVCKIAPLVTGCNSLQKFEQLYMTKNLEWVVDTYETELLKTPTLNFINSSEDITAIFKWMQGLLCALDGYMFLVSNSFSLSLASSKSKFSESMNFFLECVLLKQLNDVLNYIPNHQITVDTVMEEGQFKSLKVSIINKIITFATTLLKANTNVEHILSTPQLLWNNSMWNLICYKIFDPLSLGFHITDIDTNDSVLTLINLITEKCTLDIVDSLTNSLSTYITQNWIAIPNSLHIESFQKRLLIKGILLLRGTSVKDKLNIDTYATNTITSLTNQLIEVKEDKKIAVLLHPNALHFWELRIELALQNEQEFKRMIQYMLNTTKIESLNGELECGIYFFKTFKDVIVKHILQEFQTYSQEIFSHGSLEMIFKQLQEIVAYISHNTTHHVSLNSVLPILLNKWEDMVPYFNIDTTHRSLGIEFIRKLMLLVPESSRIIRNETNLLHWIIDLVSYEDEEWSVEQSIGFKIEVFRILPFVVNASTEEIKLRDAMQYVKNNTYFKVQIPDVNSALQTLFKILLKATAISKCRILLETITEIFVTKYDSEEFNLDLTLKHFITYISASQQVENLQCIYRMCYDIERYSWRQRYLMASHTLPYLLQHCCYSAFEAFFINNIGDIISTLKRSNNSTDLNKDDKIQKTISYIYAEILFARINVQNIENKSCPITKAAFSQGENQTLARQFTQCALATCKEHPTTSGKEEKEIFRLYNCHSYNALASLISSTQIKIDFYNWLFIREENKKDILWVNLIDIERKYKFPIEFDTLPSKRKALVNIRSTLLNKRKQTNPDIATIKYVESQHLFKSTLSEDVTKYDFTYSEVRSQAEQEINDDSAETTEPGHIELLSIDINNHECMATVCTLIQHMVENDISPLPLDDNFSLPKWMTGIKTTLMDDATPTNVKIFLLKVIHNTSQYFKPYAKEFFAPIIKIITDGCMGFSINFLITDLIIMVTSWSDVAIPTEDAELASKFLEFIMKHVDNDNKAIFKYNLEQIKLVLETWKPCLQIPYEVIYQELQKDVSSQKLDVGINLAAVVLANNIAAWDSDDQKRKDFLKATTGILKSNHRSVYQPCAEVLGMAMNFMEANGDLEVLENFKRFLCKQLDKLKTTEGQFATCLYGIALHYSSIITENYLNYMVSRLHRIHGNFKIIYLKIFLLKIETLHLNDNLSSIQFHELLLDENYEIQIHTLEIIEKCVLHFPPNLLVGVLQDVSAFATNIFSLCRAKVYDIMIIVYNIHSSQQNDLSKTCVDISKNVLLPGLLDKDTALQEKLITFWTSENNLPEDISNRFLYLLKDMYKSTIEEHYVCYSTFLLLHVLKSAEEYNEKLFEYALYKCDFEEYKLITDWRRQHASMAPLFADSLRSQDQSVSLMNPNVLRATASTLQFQPTQSSFSLTASVADYFGKTNSLSFNMTSKSELDEGVFKNPNVVLPKLPVRRFLKNKSKVSRHFAQIEVKKSIKQAELRKERTKQAERSINMCRKYRIGDYPDIEITLSAVIVPLQILARSDAHIARKLCTSLFMSLCNKKKEQEKTEFLQRVQPAIENIFNSSTQFIPSTMGTFLDIALAFKDKMRFSPKTITTVCQHSALYSLGSLLLEEYLILNDDEYTVPSKRSRLTESDNIYWVKFAELHKEMEEWDTVTAVFLEKMNCDEKILNAIEAELSGKWREAQNLYAQVIQSDVDEQRKDFYYESYFKCFAQLAEWNQLSNCIEETVSPNKESTWDYLWDNDWNQQKLLPWYITAELRNTLSGDDNKLISCINKAASNTEQNLYLKQNFGEELAVLWLNQENYDMAKYYLNTCLTNFLEDWSHINPLFNKLRFKRLLSLKNIIDIHIFLNSMNDNNYSDQDVLNNIITSWQNTNSDSREPIFISEGRTSYRIQFISVLNKKLTEFDSDIIESNLKSCRSKMYMNLIESALEQGNYYVARKYIKLLPRNSNSTQQKLCLGKILLLKSQVATNDAEKMKDLLLSWQNTVNDSTPAPNDVVLTQFVQTRIHIYQITQEISSIISNNPSLLNDNQAKLKKLMIDYSISDVTSVWQYGFSNLKSSLTNCENEIQNMMNNDNLKVYEYIAKAYVKLAYNIQEKDNFKSDFITFVLRAIKYGSLEGRQLFPCLLNTDIGTVYKDTFLKEKSEIPVWMFLGWLPQLLANLDTSIIFAVSDIVVEIAKLYPQAIMYAYRLSKEKYLFTDDEIGRFGRQITDKLDDILLNDELINTFLMALTFVASPSKVISYHLKKLESVAQSKENLESSLNNLVEEVFPKDSSSRSESSVQGSIFKEVRKYEDKIKKACEGKPDAVRKSLQKLRNEFDNPRNKKSVKLSDYSPWLANFQTTDLSSILEIPGQYTGHRQPLTQFHVKIIGFSSTVEHLDSLRAPIKVTVLGNNGKEYQYIIKYGEDLRQDQRIEQIFGIMNNILSYDPNCQKRQLSICTYQLIPLNTRLGLIECVQNTTDLKKFIGNGLNDKQKSTYAKIRGDYSSWIQKAVPRNAPNDYHTVYGSAAKKYSRETVITKYTSLVNAVAMDVLRKSFWNISVNSESFFALRQKFITSYAVMCISHWLIGIGDRHLENCLISFSTGDAVGIDFGHAFGTATQILPVPELVPFRLTPHILNLLQPLGEKGLFQEIMIHCLKAYRNNHELLLATMDVFIKEPSLDWLEFARRSAMGQDSTCQDWFPNQKIQHVKEKFKGANPTKIMIEELKAGHSRSQFLKFYVDLVQGSPQTDFRARKNDNLSEEDQVKCLLDQSTDYNLLGRMWEGWNSWI